MFKKSSYNQSIAGLVFTIFSALAFLSGITVADINEKITQLGTGPADFNDIIAIFGQPSDYRWGKQRFKLEDLPVERYWVWYPDSIHILMNWNLAVRLEIVDPAYIFNDKVPMGSSLERVISVVGHPKEVVVGRQGWEDGILYKDINGQVGWCNYTRKDLSADFRFLNYTLNCIHIFPEVKSSSVTGSKAPMRGSKLEETATSPKPVSDINAKVAQLDIDTATLDDVIEIFGEPTKYHWAGQTYTKDNLPHVYIAQYPNKFGVVILRGHLDELRFESPAAGYLFHKKIRVGSSLDEVLEVVGQPAEIVEGQPCGWVDGVLYKDIDGRTGYCYYKRGDQNVRFFFTNYKVNALYITAGSKDAGKGGSSRDVKPIESVREFGDVRDKDLSKLDLSTRKGLIATLNFNRKTVWPGPDKMPVGCDQNELMTNAMNPGLGVRRLHKQGITGKGVNVAIIDQPMYLDHPEFAGKIVAYYDTGCGSESSMHGPAVTSLLVGTNCGTAPDARVYYAAAPSWKGDTAYEARALDWITKQNRKLPASEKIRVVSVSAAPSSPSVRDKNQHMWGRACARAEAAGIMVLDCTNDHGFIGACWYNARVPESVSQCNPGYPGLEGRTRSGNILVPASPRTTAEEYNKGDCSYQYYGRGGLSWAIPYCAGVLAMGWQIRPDLGSEKMKELLFESAHEKRNGAKIINPGNFIRLVKNASPN